MKFKSLAMKLTAAAMTAVLAFQNPVQAYAASKPVYISDLLISYAKGTGKDDIAAAKKWLTDKGYVVLDQDLNADTDNIVSKKRPVFLGYKMTSNPKEAVTDIRLMNMNGDYSYDDYAELVTSQREEIGLFLEQIKTALKAYRENYSIVQEILGDYGADYDEIDTVLAEHPDDFDAGCYRAMITYEMLNLYIDDDTGYPLGDLLLEPIVEEITDWTQRRDGEWDPDAADGAHADMTTIIMQGNSAAVISMMDALAYSADPEYDSTFLTRAAESDGLTGILDRYQTDYPALTASKLQSCMKADYDSDALTFASMLSQLKDTVGVYTESGLALDSDSAEVEAYFKEHEDLSALRWMNGGIISEGLSEVSVAGTPLYDLLCTDEYDFTKPEDRSELYPLLDAMTDSQRALMNYVPADHLFMIALTEGDDAWKEAYDTNHREAFTLKPVSVYDGVNRAMFDTNGGTALTRTALNHQTATHEVYNGQIGETARQTAMRILGISALVSFGVGAGLSFASNRMSISYVKEQRGLFNDSIQLAEGQSRGILAQEELLGNAEGFVDDVADDSMERISKDLGYEAGNPESNYSTASNTKFGRILGTVGTVICIAAAIMMIAAGVLAILEFLDTNVEYKRIPKYMVHGKELEKTAYDTENKWQYTYYQCVKCNRVEFGLAIERTLEMSDCGDLNGDVGKEWVAVYFTKNKAAGDPILAKSLTVSRQSQTPLNHYALSYFGEETPANLSNPNYVFNTAAPAVYLYFRHNENAYTGTVTSTGTAILIGTLAALAGGAVGYFALSRSGKKRKEEVAAA
ncbi:MAG: hypothetical protein IKS42_08595 [Oscillospiraceae bacterium]|nr:hypothetical protein [Oscillospiraceae bacterium]